MKLTYCLSLLILTVFTVSVMPSTSLAGKAMHLSASPFINPGSQESTAAVAGPNESVAPSLYQINFISPQPVARLMFGEYSTGEIFATWRPANKVSSPGKYYVTALSGELFILVVNNSTNGGQIFSVFNRYANQLRIRMDYPDMTFEETVSNLPLALYNCALDEVEDCSPGAMVPDAYQGCNYTLSGFVEIIITDSDGTWDKFKKNVVLPLQDASDWPPSDVWLYFYQKVGKGYYAEVRITTGKCLSAIAQKLQGSPAILASYGRQLSIHYR